MGIVLARIDNRLLHGIVATQWAGRSGAQRIMIIDDTVANNELTKASMKLADLPEWLFPSLPRKQL